MAPTGVLKPQLRSQPPSSSLRVRKPAKPRKLAALMTVPLGKDISVCGQVLRLVALPVLVANGTNEPPITAKLVETLFSIAM